MGEPFRFRLSIPAAGLLLALGLLLSPPTQGPGERFFPETGHTVREPFLRFFEAHGGVDFLGYPITPAVPEPPDQIQCFQYACLRWEPLAPPEEAVQLLPIAEAMGLGAPPLPPERIPLGRPFRRYIPETGHTVSAMFLAFWLRHGGAKVLGNPITEPFLENGRIVQVFQRMKVGWDPVDQQVRPLPLGELYAQARGMSPRVPARIAGPIPALRVQLLLHRPIVAVGEIQRVTVLVTDETGRPVPQARVRVEAPGADPLERITDEQGKAEGAFGVGAFPSGTLVEVRAVASDGVRQAETFAAFRVWP